MSFRVFVAAMAAALLTACASVNETYAPDGRKAYALNCSGSARGWDKCESAAGRLCKEAGYDIVSRSGERGAVVSGSSSGVIASTTSERSMVVACKK